MLACVSKSQPCQYNNWYADAARMKLCADKEIRSQLSICQLRVWLKTGWCAIAGKTQLLQLLHRSSRVRRPQNLTDHWAAHRGSLPRAFCNTKVRIVWIGRLGRAYVFEGCEMMVYPKQAMQSKADLPNKSRIKTGQTGGYTAKDWKYTHWWWCSGGADEWSSRHNLDLDIVDVVGRCY